MHADDASEAWTAEHAGRPVGHACRLGPLHGSEDAAAMNRAGARAHGCAVGEVGWVATLFLDPAVRGLGVGRALLATAVAGIRSAGLRPCLQVLPLHSAALALYESTGWTEALRIRPAWLRETLGEDGPDVRVMVLPGSVSGPPG